MDDLRYICVGLEPVVGRCWSFSVEWWLSQAISVRSSSDFALSIAILPSKFYGICTRVHRLVGHTSILELHILSLS